MANCTIGCGTTALYTTGFSIIALAIWDLRGYVQDYRFSLDFSHRHFWWWLSARYCLHNTNTITIAPSPSRASLHTLYVLLSIKFPERGQNKRVLEGLRFSVMAQLLGI